jgi:Flp pilus assembly pilin Flp
MLSNLMQYLFAALATAKEEGGQTLVEYALIIVLVSIACIAALGLMTGALNGVWGQVTTALGGA